MEKVRPCRHYSGKKEPTHEPLTLKTTQTVFRFSRNIYYIYSYITKLSLKTLTGFLCNSIMCNKMYKHFIFSPVLTAYVVSECMDTNADTCFCCVECECALIKEFKSKNQRRILFLCIYYFFFLPSTRISGWSS